MVNGLFKENYYIRIFNVVLFLVLAIVGTGFSVYVISTAGSTYTYLLGIFLLLLSVVSGFFNVFAAFLYYRSYFYDKHMDELKAGLKPLKRFPTIAVAVPVYNEDPKIVKRNMLELLKVKYPRDKLKFYFLDDSTKPELSSEFKKFSAEHGIRYLHRENRKALKAGNLNNMLKHSKEEFVAVFDYDEYLVNKNFLVDVMPLLP